MVSTDLATAHQSLPSNLHSQRNLSTLPDAHKSFSFSMNYTAVPREIPEPEYSEELQSMDKEKNDDQSLSSLSLYSLHQHLSTLQYDYFFRIVASTIESIKDQLTLEYSEHKLYLVYDGNNYYFDLKACREELPHDEEIFGFPESQNIVSNVEIKITYARLYRLPTENIVADQKILSFNLRNNLVYETKENSYENWSKIYEAPEFEWSGECRYWNSLHGSFTVTNNFTHEKHSLNFDRGQFVSISPYRPKKRECCIIL